MKTHWLYECSFKNNFKSLWLKRSLCSCEAVLCPQCLIFCLNFWGSILKFICITIQEPLDFKLCVLREVRGNHNFLWHKKSKTFWAQPLLRNNEIGDKRGGAYSLTRILHLWNSNLYRDFSLILWLKLRHYEMATKFEEISHLFWHLLSNVKTSGRFFSNFWAFSDNLSVISRNHGLAIVGTTDMHKNWLSTLLFL